MNNCKCECGEVLSSYPNGCPTCGAPVCCNKCCREDVVEYSMVMTFLDGSEAYVLGFEAGKAWGLCETKQWPNQMLAHTSNVRQIELVAKHFRCDMFVELSTESPNDISSGTEWCSITFTPQPKVKLSLVMAEYQNGVQAAAGGLTQTPLEG